MDDLHKSAKNTSSIFTFHKVTPKVLGCEETIESNDLDKTCKYIALEKSLKADSMTNLSDISSLSELGKRKFYDNKVIFMFNGNKNEENNISFNFGTAVEACPLIINNIEELPLNTKVTSTINVPEWIAYNDLMEYFFYFKNKTTHNFKIQIHNLLRIAIYFQNTELTKHIIYKEVIPKLKNNNTIVYLELSYTTLSNKKQEVDRSWFDLFVTSLDHISKNLLTHLNLNYHKLIKVNSLLLEEIVEK